MVLRRMGILGLGVLFTVGLAMAACDDETETTPTPTGTTSGTTTTGSGGGTGGSGNTGGTASGTASGTGGTGGSSQGGGGTGGSGAHGGQGTGGGCITCSDVWLHGDDPADLCTNNGPPSSVDVFEGLKTCGCDGTCPQCVNNLCQDNDPSGACQGCLSSDCASAVTACTDDS